MKFMMEQITFIDSEIVKFPILIGLYSAYDEYLYRIFSHIN